MRLIADTVSGPVDSLNRAEDQDLSSTLMEVPKASRGGRSYLSLSDAGQAAGEMPVDVSGTSKVPGLAVADRPLNAYAAASITPDAGGVTPPFTARTSISNPTSMDYRSKQLALLGPLRPQPTKVWKRKFVKLMVVGDSGLGKTTLISALLSKPGEQLQVHDGTNTPLNQFLKDPDSLITRVTWKDEQDKVGASMLKCSAGLGAESGDWHQLPLAQVGTGSGERSRACCCAA
eukprot:GHRQ01035321.1.p1 GENE.GHRQ01035321.1~~GHRQ01035321.1.p1  ORF type:complete len:232 (+),score=86.06 GHRQ01035321.1:92-787(+)